MYYANVVEDSITECGIRALTMEMRYPYAIHQDMLTYRSIAKSDDLGYEWWLEFSRSSASNRALTMESIIESIREDPVIPKFRKQNATMVPGDYLSSVDQYLAKQDWLEIIDFVTKKLEYMKAKYKIHKSQLNRAMGPYQYITTVFTANEEHWLHFFNERAHRNADPLLQPVAYIAKEAYQKSVPELLKFGEWHLPFVNKHADDIIQLSTQDLVKISTARCARTSYLRQDAGTAVRDDLRLYDDLVVRAPGTEIDNPRHAAPAEHQLMAAASTIQSGNIRGFFQNRKLLGF